MIKLAVGGFKGRMGQCVLSLLREDSRFEITAQLEVDTETTAAPFDVLIDFSVPTGTARFVELCLERRAALVSGTTGQDAAQLQQIEQAAQRIAVLRASNFSLGVNALLKVLPAVVRELAANFDIEIVETHHTRKVDAPSGTALSLLDSILETTGRTRAKHVVFGRQGHAGAKPREEIAVHAVRSGSTVGRHDIIFGGTGESILLSHEALSRETFAKGAIEAAAWITGRPAALYDMQDVLADPKAH